MATFTATGRDRHGRRFTWTMENPRAMMRRAVADYHPELGEPLQVAYCTYGPIGPVDVLHGPRLVYAQKATDIWTNLAFWEPLMCHARGGRGTQEGPGPTGSESLTFVYRDGKPCHERAERGSRAGIQRIKGADARALLPAGLSLAWCLAAERETRYPDRLGRHATVKGRTGTRGKCPDGPTKHDHQTTQERRSSDRPRVPMHLLQVPPARGPRPPPLRP